MFSVMWSEHCSYKSSQAAAADAADRRARASSPARARTPASISIGDGLAVAFKIEIAQPPERGRAVPGRGDRRRRDPARHLHDGRAARSPSSTRCASATRPTPRTRHLVDGRRARASAATATASACRRSAASSSSTRATRATRSSTSWRSGCSRSGLLTLAAAPGPGNLVVLFGSTTGRDGIGGASVARQRDVHRRRPLQAAVGPGRRPVRREAADRGVPRAHRARARRGPPGPRRRRDHLRDVGDRGPGRDRDRRRPRRDPAARAGPGAVRGDDLGVAGADVRRRPAGALAGGPRGLRALGPAGRGHRAGDRRRRHRGRRGRPRRRTAGPRRAPARSPASRPRP